MTEYLTKPYEPVEVDDIMLAFPADVIPLMPAWEDIPEEFKERRSNQWCEIASDWFMGGLSADVEMMPKPGIDPEKAYRHLRAVLGSFQPKHQHKEAAVAFLLSEWFEWVRNWKDEP